MLNKSVMGSDPITDLCTIIGREVESVWMHTLKKNRLMFLRAMFLMLSLRINGTISN